MKNTARKKHTGAIIAIVVILLVLAAGGIYAYTMYTNAMQEKEATYNLAAEYEAAGNHRDAYKTYLKAEGFQDADQKAAQLLQQMTDAAKKQMDTAQMLSDLQYNTIAGLYLTEMLADANQFTLDDYNKMAEMVGNFYALASQQYAEVQLINDKNSMTLPVMEALMPRIEALEESSDPQEALLVIAELKTFSLADQVFSHCWKNGAFTDTSIYTLAEALPLWVPMMDQVISATESLDVVALVNKS